MCLLLAACRSALPWAAEQLGSEFNISFVVERNLVRLSTVEINGRPGRFYFASAHVQSVVDPSFASSIPGRRYRLHLNERESRPVSPVILDLHDLGDALIGADAWTPHAVTIDYLAGLVTLQKKGIYPAEMSLFRFAGPPAVVVEVDGRAVTAIVDTASPDTLTLPRAGAAGERRQARIRLAGTDFGMVDVALADVSAARIGNRLLSKFLITIDYGRQQVGLWRDPRIP